MQKDLFLVLVILLSLNGCTFISQKVELYPNVTINKEDIGRGKQISLIVEDQRTKKELGYRSQINTGRISLKGDIVDQLKLKMREILVSKGFVVVDDPNTERTCILRVKNIEYQIQSEVINILIITSVYLDIDVKNTKEVSRFFRNYHSEDETRVPMAPTAKQNEKMINNTLEKVLDLIASDLNLYQTLAI